MHGECKLLHMTALSRPREKYAAVGGGGRKLTVLPVFSGRRTDGMLCCNLLSAVWTWPSNPSLTSNPAPPIAVNPPIMPRCSHRTPWDSLGFEFAKVSLSLDPQADLQGSRQAICELIFRPRVSAASTPDCPSADVLPSVLGKPLIPSRVHPGPPSKWRFSPPQIGHVEASGRPTTARMGLHLGLKGWIPVPKLI